MPVRTGLLGLGSNLGDRRAQLQAAVDALADLRSVETGVSVSACSSVYDTDPVGEVPDQSSFLNACLEIETALEPLDLLEALKKIELALGRRPGGARHGPRPIDIDVLLLGELVLEHSSMTLPHDQLLKRRFVLVPALELDFQARTPRGERLADALASLPLDEGVRLAGSPLDVPS